MTPSRGAPVPEDRNGSFSSFFLQMCHIIHILNFFHFWSFHDKIERTSFFFSFFKLTIAVFHCLAVPLWFNQPSIKRHLGCYQSFAIMVNFMCNWFGHKVPNIWLNIISGCVFEGVLYELNIWSSGLNKHITFPKVGGSQLIHWMSEEIKGWRKNSLSAWLSLRWELIFSCTWSQTQIGTMPLALLDLDFSASIIVRTNSSKPVSLSINMERYRGI